MGIKENGLVNILFSKARQAVLALLYGRPDQSFYTNEIIRLTKVGTGAIQRELQALSAAELIAVSTVGNQKRYSANRNSFLFTELRSIVLKTFGLADVMSHELASIAESINIAFIYGSIAKQEDSTNSDIDLMLICDNLTYADIFPLLDKAQTKLGRTINPTIYSPSAWKRKIKANNNFVHQVIQQPKIFLIGKEDELIKLR